RETGRMAGGVGQLLLGNGDSTFTEMTPDRSGIVISGDGRAAVTLDYDGDGKDDIAVAVNNGLLRLFHSLHP
ncbi:MAG: FG-GAP repeat domain-containing protein, partial [Verrucomicrobiales bacterium]